MTGGFNPKPYKGKGTPGRRARGSGGKNYGRNPQPGYGGGGGGGNKDSGCKLPVIWGAILISLSAIGAGWAVVEALA